MSKTWFRPTGFFTQNQVDFFVSNFNHFLAAKDPLIRFKGMLDLSLFNPKAP